MLPTENQLSMREEDLLAPPASIKVLKSIRQFHHQFMKRNKCCNFKPFQSLSVCLFNSPESFTPPDGADLTAPQLQAFSKLHLGVRKDDSLHAQFLRNLCAYSKSSGRVSPSRRSCPARSIS